jgi:hypothetical protein
MALDLQRWVTWIFDQPVPEPSLYWNAEELGPIKPTSDMLTFISQLFENPAGVLEPFSDAQLNQGFWFICGPESDVMRGLVDESIAWDVRARFIRSFAGLFRELFTARCTHHLSHMIRGGDSDASPLNSACYMWWDFDCFCPGSTSVAAHKKVDEEFLEVMRLTLALPHDACRESALHGLGHWHRAYPDETVNIIDTFLARNQGIREELRRYALAARCGCIQ